MDSNRSRFGMLIGLGAAAGALGVAALMSAAAAPTARADDFSAIVTDVEGNLAAGQTSFGEAWTDFSGGDVTDGLAAYFQGVDDDFVSAPDSVLLGTADALAGQPINGFANVIVSAPPDFADALTDVAGQLNVAQTISTDAVTALSAGDYLGAFGDELDVSLYGFAFAPETLLMGAVEALGLG
jgi:hypothetical protein